MEVRNSPDNFATTFTRVGEDGVKRAYVRMHLTTDQGPHTFDMSAAAAVWMGRELTREGDLSSNENMALSRERVR